MTKQFDEAQLTNEYLTAELILARQANEVLTENNRRLERLLIRSIQDLQECNRCLIEIQQQVGELATVALARVKRI
tara:strand:- start:195 stop:422 length:228 start_codon:yes stop_codon:yes gene_type:complete